MWLAHPYIVAKARCDGEFRGRLIELRRLIVAGQDVTLEEAAELLGIPFPTLAALCVEATLQANPGATIEIRLPIQAS